MIRFFIGADIMAKEYQLPFKVGQSAEARSFQSGFRSAWFRCKVRNAKFGSIVSLMLANLC